MNNQNDGNNFDSSAEPTVISQDGAEKSEYTHAAQPYTYAEPNNAQSAAQSPYQPQYPQQPQYNQYRYSNHNPYNPNPYLNGTMANNSGSGQAIAGMILGILSILNVAVPFFGTILAIVGTILSGFGMRSKNRGMAITGLVLGIISLIVSVIIMIAFIALIAYDSTTYPYWY